MKNIFLAPRSNETSYENFESTIIGGRPYSEIEPYLDNQEKEILSQYETLSVWGNKESLENRWKDMKSGDYVLFYARGSFYFSSEVILTTKNRELAKKLWPVDKNGEPWPCLFFVKNIKEVNIPIKVIQELAEYSPKWDRVQGFMRLNDKGIKAIIDKFGSVEDLINQDAKFFSSLDLFIESQKEESIEIEFEDIEELDKKEILEKALEYRDEGPSHKTVQVIKKQRIENRDQKKRVAQLEDYRCQVCEWSMIYENSKGKKVHRIDIDHIIEKSDGGGEELTNLWALCPNCHTKKTLGVITVDLENQVVKENGKIIKIKDNHLFLGVDTTPITNFLG